jgi:hypothetical protein
LSLLHVKQSNGICNIAWVVYVTLLWYLFIKQKACARRAYGCAPNAARLRCICPSGAHFHIFKNERELETEKTVDDSIHVSEKSGISRDKSG